MTSSSLSRNCQGHSSIVRMSTSTTSFIFSSTSIRLETMFMSWEPQIPTADSQGLIPVEVVSYSDSDWAGCQDQLVVRSSSYVVLSQSVFNKPYSSFNISLKCRSRTVCNDSGNNRFFGDQALHQGNSNRRLFQEKVQITLKTDFISRQNYGITTRHLQRSQSTLSSDICGFRTFSWKEPCHLKKWELITIPQTFSRSLFRLQCWAIIFRSSNFSKTLQCLRCSRLAPV